MSESATVTKLAGYMRGYASLFRAFPNSDLWGRPEEAELAAQHAEQASEALMLAIDRRAALTQDPTPEERG